MFEQYKTKDVLMFTRNKNKNYNEIIHDIEHVINFNNLNVFPSVIESFIIKTKDMPIEDVLKVPNNEMFTKEVLKRYLKAS